MNVIRNGYSIAKCYLLSRMWGGGGGGVGGEEEIMRTVSKLVPRTFSIPPNLQRKIPGNKLKLSNSG